MLSFEGWESAIESLSVIDNPSLSSLAGLEGLESLGAARFRDNPMLPAQGLPSAFDDQDFCGNQGQAACIPCPPPD